MMRASFIATSLANASAKIQPFFNICKSFTKKNIYFLYRHFNPLILGRFWGIGLDDWFQFCNRSEQ
jgi:hypothetical protein